MKKRQNLKGGVRAKNEEKDQGVEAVAIRAIAPRKEEEGNIKRSIQRNIKRTSTDTRGQEVDLDLKKERVI